MTDWILARKEGRAGRITFNRPAALNALDHDMAAAIEKALADWRHDPAVQVVIIDAEGPRAFCAGGDIATIYHLGKEGDFEIGPRFWRSEYRLNARIKDYEKPILAFMQGFVMGGGVGIGGHARHRIVGDTTQIAMPETGIGLIPDVGGTLILALAPGRIGEYLGLTGGRIAAADALYAGFADTYIPEADWPGLIAKITETGDPTCLPKQLAPAQKGRLADLRPEIDAAFGGGSLREIVGTLDRMQGDFAQETATTLRRVSALSAEATLRLIRMTRATPTIRDALSNEFRFTLRAVEKAEFLEGVRAQIIDKDRKPNWRYSLETLPEPLLAELLAPLPAGWEIPFDA